MRAVYVLGKLSDVSGPSLEEAGRYNYIKMLPKFAIEWVVYWILKFLVPSVRTETEPNYPKPKFLGSAFSK